MSADLDELGQMLRDTVERYTLDHYGFDQRWAVLAEQGAYGHQVWADCAAFGWLGLRLPEADGGLDAPVATLGGLMEIVGARLMMEPLLASAILGTGVLLRAGSNAQKAQLLPSLIDGSIKLAVDLHRATGFVTTRDGVSGQQAGLLHGDIADRIIVPARGADNTLSLYLVDPSGPGAARRPYRLIDGRGAAVLSLRDAPAEPLGPAATGLSVECVLARARDEMSVALCAEALGAVGRLIAATGTYLTVRVQFGRSIGSNQALQHRLVEMFILQQEIAALTRQAEQALDDPSQHAARLVAAAAAYTAPAARRIANEAVQMHGGLGISDELDVSHYYRRILVINALLGDRGAHLARFMAETDDARTSCAEAG